MRIVALMTIRNEAAFLERCLRHLESESVQTCVIDNSSTDNSLEIARKFIGRSVFRIEHLPYHGEFPLRSILKNEQRLAAEIDADWFMHYDADEIREAPARFQSLREGIQCAEAEGYNAINFDEFVFTPTAEQESFPSADYVANLRYYYYYQPKTVLRHVKLWKKPETEVDLVSSGGHSAKFEGRRVFPHHFILRHYMTLSREHAIAKYSRRVYAEDELNAGWHRRRARFDPATLRFPTENLLKQWTPGRDWDRSDPWNFYALFEPERLYELEHARRNKPLPV